MLQLPWLHTGSLGWLVLPSCVMDRLTCVCLFYIYIPSIGLRDLLLMTRFSQIHHLVFHISFLFEPISHLYLCSTDWCFCFVLDHHFLWPCQLMAQLMLRAALKPHSTKFYLWPRVVNNFFVPTLLIKFNLKTFIFAS